MRAARSASRDGCARRLRASGGWRSARSSACRPWSRPRGRRLRMAESWWRPQRPCGRRFERGWMGTDPKETTERKGDHRLGDLGFTRIPAEEDPRRKNPELLAAIEKIAPGTGLREAVDDVIRSHEGALIVVGDPNELSFLYSGGIRLDAPFRPQLLYELAKMDGAIIVDEAVKRLAWANVQLMPDPT